MPRYTSKCLVEQTTNGDTARQFVDTMLQLGYEVIVVSCPVWYYRKPYRQFKYECSHPNLAAILNASEPSADQPVFDTKRLWDEEDQGRSYL